jgi:hypothetical protein
LEKKHTEPKKLTLFFEQSKLEAFFEKRVTIDSRNRVFSLDKGVDKVDHKMLHNPNHEDHKLAGDCAMEVFSLVFVIENDDSKTIVHNNVVVSTAVEFEYVVSLLAAGLTFNQISKVVDSNRDVFGTAGKY